MPKTQFSSANKIETKTSFPLLKLKYGEKAKIVCLEEPTYNYVHTLKAPEIGADGKAILTTEKRTDGTSYETFKMGFIGRPRCLGDLGIIEARGLDPKNCPACEAAQRGDHVDSPKHRYAVHVIRYATKPGSFELMLPYSVSVQVWAFTLAVYNTLSDFVDDPGPLPEHDLLLGPCDSEVFQKFAIVPSHKAAWLEDEERKARTLSTFKENKAEDLEAIIGRRPEVSWLRDDLEKIKERWRIANGGPAPAPTQVERASLEEGLAGLRHEVTSDTDDLLSVPPAPGPVGHSAESQSLEDILNDLNLD